VRHSETRWAEETSALSPRRLPENPRTARPAGSAEGSHCQGARSLEIQRAARAIDGDEAH
jgi:hypothetical protein